MTPDPLSEKYYGSSPYAYCDGDPVNYIDPDGRSWFQNTKTGQIYYNKALLIMSENSNYDSKDWSLLFSNSKYDSLIVRQYDHLCDLNGGFLFDSRVSKQMMSHIRYEFKTTKELVHVKETIMRYPEGMSQISIVQKDDLTENILESRYVPKNANKHTISAKYIKTIAVSPRPLSQQDLGHNPLFVELGEIGTTTEKSRITTSRNRIWNVGINE